MKINRLIIFIAIILVLQSCNDSSNPIIPISSNFVYPLKVDNKWSYSSSIIYTNARPDSIKNLLNNFFYNFQVSVTKDTVLDSIQVYELREVSNDYSDSYAYYSNEVEGFLKYAYSNSPNQGLPKSNTVKRFLYKGTYFNNVIELIKEQEECVLMLKTLSDSLNFFRPARIIYMYPLEVGKEWVFNSEYVFINKEIIGKELVRINSESYECFKIKWKYDFDMDGNWDEDFAIYEYVCSKGILKVAYTIKDMTITSSEHPDGIGKADVNYERVLNSTNF